MQQRLLDEICQSCGGELREWYDEMRCVACYPPSYAEMEAVMHSQLQPWLRQRLDTTDGANLREVAEEAVNHFLSDPHFLATTVARLINAAAREEAQRIIRAKRGGAVLLGDVVASRTELEQRARTSPLWAWMETVGERKIRLPDMTREDLLLAAKDRQIRAGRELLIARFWERLAGEMAPGQTVGSRFSAEEVDALTHEREELEATRSRPPALREGKNA